MNDKFLNLTDVTDEQFENIKTAVEGWKETGMDGAFGFVTEAEAQQCKDIVQKAFSDTYARGAVHGVIAFVAGYGITWLAFKGVEYIASKKKKEVE